MIWRNLEKQLDGLNLSWISGIIQIRFLQVFGWQQIGNQKQVASTHRIMKRIQISPTI